MGYWKVVVAVVCVLASACAPVMSQVAPADPTARSVSSPPTTSDPNATQSAPVPPSSPPTAAPSGATPAPTTSPATTASATPATTPATALTPWQSQLSAHIVASVGPGTDISVSIASPNRGLIFQHNPDLELWPASNQKILTAIGALELLPSDHRFTTTVQADGVIEGGVLAGDLVLVAGGDPTLTVDGLRSLAHAVRANGIDRVEGDLLIDTSRYDEATMAPGWQDWQVPTYVGPLSALVVDDNRWRTDPEYLADPAAANATRFVEVLAAAGVQVGGDVRHGTGADAGTVVAAQASAPLSELLTRMVQSSDNEIAESVIREIGRVVEGDGSTQAGLAAVRTALENKGFALAGRDGDGSGLSRANYRSAEGWRQLLAYAQSAPWGEAFIGDLPVSGRSGTLAGRLTHPVTLGMVAAKTGTIIGGRALSGYATLPDGDVAQFSIVVNGEGADAALGLIDEILVRLLTDPPPTP